MAYFIQACIKDNHIFTVRSQTTPIEGYSVSDDLDFAVNAEVEGPQVDAGEVMATLVLSGQTISGLPVLWQEVI